MEGITTNVAVKLSYEGQLRRFPLNGTSFAQFYEQVVEILGLDKTADLVFKYTDEENDLITISSDMELSSAIVPGQLLRVVAAVRGAPQRVVNQDAPVVPSMPTTYQAYFLPPPPGFAPHMYHQPAPAEATFAPPVNFGAFSHGAGFAGQSDEKTYAKHEKKIHKAYARHEKHAKKAEKHHHKRMDNEHKHARHEQKRAHHGQDKLVARFVADVTIEDGTAFLPNTHFLKTWRVRNEGVMWPAGCRLMFVGKAADNMNAPPIVPIDGVVNTMQELNISVPLVAPEKPGRYTAYFRMCTADGRKFGQRVWVSIVVASTSGGGDSSSEGEKEADKYEAIVDLLMRNELLRSTGMKRHWVFRIVQKCDGDVEKVNKKLEKKLAKQSKKCRKE